MNRNIQTKIVLIFFILGIILIAGTGLSYIYMLKNLEVIAGSQVEMIDTINKQINKQNL